MPIGKDSLHEHINHRRSRQLWLRLDTRRNLSELMRCPWQLALLQGKKLFPVLGEGAFCSFVGPSENVTIYYRAGKVFADRWDHRVEVDDPVLQTAIQWLHTEEDCL